MSFKDAKIALVFDWMTTHGGAEKVNLQLHKMFPEAEIFASIFNQKKFKGFEKAKIHTSFIQNLPFAKTKHQLFLGLMPYAYELFDLSKFDIVISSSHSCSKGVITKPETMHICYCHSPMRYAWDNWQSYINDYKMNSIFKRLGRSRMHKIRIWDRLSAERVDHFIANSTTTQRRIQKYYHKNSTVIHPAINIKKHQLAEKTKGYFLAVGRLTASKKFNLTIEAFNRIGLPLKIVGEGIDQEFLAKSANSNIEFLGYVKDQELRTLYSECEALIFPQIEDFGLTAIESMASGRPVIAYNQGGALDFINQQTGILFDKQTPESLIGAIEKYQKEKKNFHPAEIRNFANTFDHKSFEKNFLKYLQEKWQKWQQRN